MAPQPNIPAFLQQNLLIEFTSLKTTCPPGLYLSLSPQSKLIWHIAYFPRKGPYAEGIYMFTLHFPSSYPLHAPVLKCTCPGVAHPLIDPITGEVSLAEIFPPAAGGKQLPPVPGEPGPVVPGRTAGVVELLRYLKRCFEDEEAIKKIPNWAVRDGRAMRAWREGKGREVVGLGILDADTIESEVIRFVDLPPEVEREVFDSLGIEGA